MEGELQTRVGINLRGYRLKLGLSQEEFADQLVFHRTYMGAIERGERNLTLRSVERIADRLGIDAMALLLAPEGHVSDPG
jgi:transcriptional regulator with XRE-family HTH domain